MWHTWKAARYYSAWEAMREMLQQEVKMHEDPNRLARMNVMEFSRQVLDALIEKELKLVHEELTTYFKLKEELKSKA